MGNMPSAMKSRDAFLFAVLFAVAGASNCELRFDTAMSADFYKNVRVSQSACCSLCTNDSRCRTAVYSPQGGCHLHDATDSAHPFADRGWTLMIKKTQTIVDLAVATPDLSTLVAALKAGGLVDTLWGKGPFTVFAPTNEAFGKLPAATLAHLLEPANVKELDAILTYHVVSGVAAFSKDLTDSEKIKTVEGQSVVAHVSAAGVMINGATVQTADIAASNGVIHIIDKVLSLPPAPAPVPTKSIVQLAQSVPDLSTLVTALPAGELTTTLSSRGPFTVFAPTNEAFAKLPAATLAHLLDPKNIKELQRILEYHVIPGAAIHAADLKSFQTARTLEGQAVTIVKRNGDILVDKSKVITADVDATNGVVHIINAVLI